MPYVGHLRPRLRPSVALAIPALVLQGCFLLAEHYPAPPQPLRPTTVGVIAETTLVSSGYHERLVDGREVDLPNNGEFRLLGDLGRGNLLLSGITDGGFAIGLMPSGSGCWEAWQGPSSHPIVWDRGSSILFMNGLDLPKADGFYADPTPQTVDGRLAWTRPNGDGVPPQYMTFCANDRGEIESAVRP